MTYGSEHFKADDSGFCVGEHVVHKRLRWRGQYLRMYVGSDERMRGRAICKTSPRDDTWMGECRWEPSDLIPGDLR